MQNGAEKSAVIVVSLSTQPKNIDTNFSPVQDVLVLRVRYFYTYTKLDWFWGHPFAQITREYNISLMI